MQAAAYDAIQRLMQSLPEGTAVCSISETSQGIRLTRCELGSPPVVLQLPWAERVQSTPLPAPDGPAHLASQMLHTTLHMQQHLGQKQPWLLHHSYLFASASLLRCIANGIDCQGCMQEHPVQQLLGILEDSTGSMQGTQEDPAADSRAARQAWWSKRQALDVRMQALLHTLQASLGPWRWVPEAVSRGSAAPHSRNSGSSVLDTELHRTAGAPAQCTATL